MTTPRRRLDEALAELRRAREEIEALLAEGSGTTSSLFDSSRSLRAGFAQAIEQDRLNRLEQRAEKKARPTTADLFAEAIEDAFRRTRGTATDDNPDEN